LLLPLKDTMITKRRSIMERSGGTVTFSTRQKNDIFAKAYESAVNDNNNNQREFQSFNASRTLEDDFSNFMHSHPVEVYYYLTSHLTLLLEKVYSHLKKKNMCELANDMAALLQESRDMNLLQTDKGRCHLKKEVNLHLDKIEETLIHHIEALPACSGLKYKEEFYKFLRHQWDQNRTGYVEQIDDKKVKKVAPLERVYVMEELFWFNVKNEEETYEKRWLDALQQYFLDQDYYNMRIVMTLESTQNELEIIYQAMKNMVSFKALVMLAIWRYEHNPKLERSFQDLLGEKDECILAYGNLSVDYPRFLEWHQNGYSRYSVTLHVCYIEFAASRLSEAIHVSLKPLAFSRAAQNKQPQTLTFVDLFIQANETLALSYMRTRQDFKVELQRKEVVLVYNDEEEEEEDKYVELKAPSLTIMNEKGERRYTVK
jgi:hypothetical protein